MMKKTLRTIVVSAVFLCCATVAGAAGDPPPSNALIQTWWKKHSRERMTIEGKPQKIGLIGGEKAYIAPIQVGDRGRNFMAHAVLVRPSVKDAQEVPDPVGPTLEVHDLNGDGISEIVTESSGSGQGLVEGIKAIVQFDGWRPVVLHKAAFSDNVGCCEVGCGTCESTEVAWKFLDLDGDGKKDLVEEIVVMGGKEPDAMKTVRKTVNRYLFKGNAFVKTGANGGPR